jgi:hypothetical protein
MNVGVIVKVLATGQEPRDMMYAGWIGKVVEIRDGRSRVDSDAAGRLQAVSFCMWFPNSELEMWTGEPAYRVSQ